ncbi:MULTISPECIES: hypothetical protein [Heyndrickxia]|uniref:Uncharacterized protein n=1 Tax=Heyndrickxia oleronia TaxID=38875 RepID=A0A8E2ICA7_9BACI|nr:hypothetical protein [Heyndrickxia oleronia]MBU5213284.1 hypothetical protein [Heyndrickxia oleronia]MCI1591392.1 hypothetical protein [Heyndrickxia oleronia]MCI1613880.1 hypothetical protein [Heyndrickxia oleronia]MCI1745010.1 hypothetical protein [Heyndrickxia oleronia]MCI1761774.1 hypothetical protein [Heyndrickxia oleronia]
MEQRKIYLLLTDTGTMFTRMIKLFTQEPLNHASLAFDDNLVEVYSFGRKNMRNPFIGGFVKENIRTGLFKHAKCAIYSCTVSEKQYQEMRRKIINFENNKQNYKYNLIGLIGVLFNIEIERKNAYFCSQFVASVLKDSGVVLINKPLAFVTPSDLKATSPFQLVYEGKLNFYFSTTEMNQNSNNQPLLLKTM